METMKTVEENRRDWLVALIDQHGSIAALNIKLDRDRTYKTKNPFFTPLVCLIVRNGKEQNKPMA
jgi:hypothetical protein